MANISKTKKTVLSNINLSAFFLLSKNNVNYLSAFFLLSKNNVNLVVYNRGFWATLGWTQ